MVLRLRRQPFLLVVGPSGSGKSSLVFAGLLPRLARQQSDAWHVVTLRPGSEPMALLQEKLGGDPEHPAATVESLLAAHPAPPAGTLRLLVVVDQLEELFALRDRSEERRFLAALKGLWAQDRCRVVLTLRADFYPDLMGSELWPVSTNARQEIAPLKGAALQRAIVQPAADVGVGVEDKLVMVLLAETDGQPGCLPLLQETLRVLWEGMTGRMLTRRAYEALGRTYAQTLGGETGAAEETPSGLEVALALHADATLARLTGEQQVNIARRIFLRLIQFGEGRPDTRRQQPVSQLQATGEDLTLFVQTLAVLTDSRLLTVSAKEGDKEETVDISHEALIRNWPAMRGWLRERQGAEQTRRRLEDKAREWLRLGQQDGGLLDAVELADADRWLDSPDAADLGVSATLLALVEASRAALAAEAQEKQAAYNRERRLERQGRRLSYVIIAILGSLVIALAGVASPLLLRFWWSQQAMVTIDSGPVILGPDPDRPSDPPTLSVTLTLSAFKIEPVEVTNRKYAVCVDVGACTPPLDGQGLRAFYNPDRKEHPVVGVTAFQAARYCAWLDRRLPREWEWERAARGAQGRSWPWGEDPPTRRNVNILFPGGLPINGTTPVKSYPDGATLEPRDHIYDLVGNAKEWTASYLQGYDKYNPDFFWNGRPENDLQLIVRGAGWRDVVAPITRRSTFLPSTARDDIGFRCADDP
jgi:formylglycine-generating enzyme required for sulfatase activity